MSLTPTTFFLDTHELAGGVDTRGFRLLDVMADATNDIVEVVDSGSRTPCYIVKSRVNLVALPDERHEAPLEQNYRFVQKRAYRATGYVPGCEVRGEIQLNSDPDPRYLLTVDLGDFFALTNATVRRRDGSTLTAPVVIVRKGALAAIRVEAEPSSQLAAS